MHIAFKKNLAFPIVVLGSRYYFKVIWNEFFQEVRAWNMSFFGDVIWLQGQVIFIAWWPSDAAVSSMQCHDAQLKKMLGSILLGFFCRHFFSTKTMPAWRARLDRDSDDVAPLPQQFGEDDVDASRPKHFSLPPHRRVVNNKQKPHCCLSAQGLHGNHNGGPTAYWCCPCV